MKCCEIFATGLASAGGLFVVLETAGCCKQRLASIHTQMESLEE